MGRKNEPNDAKPAASHVRGARDEAERQVTRRVTLEFSKRAVKRTPDLHRNLSCVTAFAGHLWLGSDEGTSLERLSPVGEETFGNHVSLDLADILNLPARRKQEIDIEGLAFQDGYLWVAGSHSLKRKTPSGRKVAEDIETLASMVRETNRYVLARIPVAEDDTGTMSLHRRVEGDGETRTAAQVFGTGHTNLLVDAVEEDRHIGRFLEVPGKENGFDVEGLAVSDRSVFLGLRGPVLRGWAVILEVKPCDLSEHYLSLEPIGPKRTLYRKHFVDLGGLGVRELALHGDDLLILAGPTMDLDGHVLLYRWPGARKLKREAIVERRDLEVELDFALTQGGPDRDHPEGIAVLPQAHGRDEVLVVYDAPDERRLKGSRAVTADVFELRR